MSSVNQLKDNKNHLYSEKIWGQNCYIVQLKRIFSWQAKQSKVSDTKYEMSVFYYTRTCLLSWVLQKGLYMESEGRNELLERGELLSLPELLLLSIECLCHSRPLSFTKVPKLLLSLLNNTRSFILVDKTKLLSVFQNSHGQCWHF